MSGHARHPIDALALLRSGRITVRVAGAPLLSLRPEDREMDVDVAGAKEAGADLSRAGGGLDGAASARAGRGRGGWRGGATGWRWGTGAGGLPADVLALADEAVAVPIYGQAESLNLAAAAAVCLYASARAQRGQ